MLGQILLVVRGRRQWYFEWSYRQILCYLKFKNIMLLKIQKYTNNLSSFIFPEPKGFDCMWDNTMVLWELNVAFHMQSGLV